MSNVSTLAASGFNPRLRLDLSSGKRPLRSLNDSTGRALPPPHAASPLPAAEPPPVDLERALALMRGRHTRDMHERHVSTLHKLAAANARGFYFCDVGSLAALLALSRAHLDAGLDAYAAPLRALLRALSSPLQKLRCNDDERYEQPLVALLGEVGTLVEAESAPVAEAAVEMLLSLVGANFSRVATPEHAAREAVAAGLRLGTMWAQKLLARSAAPRSAMRVLSLPAAAPRAVAALRLLRALSRAAESAEQIVEAEGFPRLVELLDAPLGDPSLPLAVELVWNLLDAARGRAVERLLDAGGAAALLRLHERTVGAGGVDTEKELRNEVLVLGTLLAAAGDEARAALLDGGFFEAVLRLVCGGAARGARLVVPSLVNLEMIQLALHFLQASGGASARHAPSARHSAPPQYTAAAHSLCTTHQRVPLATSPALIPLEQVVIAASSPMPAAVRDLLIETQLAQAMIELLDPEEDGSFWQPAQQQELRLRAMTLLANLSVVCPKQLTKLPRLAPTLLHYLDASTDAELRDGALHVLVDALPASPSLQQSLGSTGAVQRILDMASAVAMGGGTARGSLAPFSRTTKLSTAALHVPVGLSAAAMQDAILALSLFCGGEAAEAPAFAEEFGAQGGVAVLLRLLQPHTDTKLLLSAIDCLWNTVAGSETNTGRLVARDGILQLMDCLEATAFAPRAQLLSCLADLLADPRAVTQCKEWHGARRQCAVQQLLAMWREEEARLGGATGGARLRSTARPLRTGREAELARLNQTLQLRSEEEEEALEELVELAGGYDEASLAEDTAALANGLCLTTRTQLVISGRLGGLGSEASAVLEAFDMRSKLYAVLSQLHFAASLPLTTEEEMLLVTARNYIDFCAAEEWQNVCDEMEEAGVRPTTPDAKVLEAHLAEYNDAATKVLEQQGELGKSIQADLSLQEEAMVSRVRVLRDGPMGQVVKAKGRSLFRARIDAKAKVGDMLARSKVGYRGPQPTAEEYADATLLKLEAQLRGTTDEEDNAPPPDDAPAVQFELRHVPQALTEISSTAEADPQLVDPFLMSRGIGLSSSGKPTAQAASLHFNLESSAPSLDVHALNHTLSAPLAKDELRSMCVDYLQTAVQ
ncbi:hypothetical protein AB1Y20_015875 [Prymnesium parvum]|uniref:Cilia- and flagella-associated protein 69 ARM repeats domain-containing protein n=1 Tax=Prymnesium parvum TaxID=97485 RepID=A0AB34JZ14_PRYPA